MSKQLHTQERRKHYFKRKWIFYGLTVLFVILSVKTRFTTIFAILAIASFLIGQYFGRFHATWGTGSYGEEDTIEELKKLKGYKTLHDVNIPTRNGNIDHVAIGSNGLFAIETKHYHGHISCVGDKWQRIKIGQQGTIYEGYVGNPSKQVKGNAGALNKFILQKTGMNVFVTPIVNFSHPDIDLEIKKETVDVVTLSQLNHVIREKKNKGLSKTQINRINDLLKPFARFAKK